MRVLVLGDTHGNAGWMYQYVYPTAARAGADAIVQVGDFGYWEHEPAGVEYLDLLAELAAESHIPLYWLHGNHDKHSMVLARYGRNITMDGFLWCRPGVNYIPQGHIWEWAGVRMRAFGGAYSTDKDARLGMELRRREKIERQNRFREAAGKPLADPGTAGTLWFPEEEMTDADMDGLLAADSSKLGIVFSHDMPRGSSPGWNRKDIPQCRPNQDRLQRALLAHRPDFWFHGHLHHRYESTVRCGDDGQHTRVFGLGPDNAAAPPLWLRTDSWGVLDFGDGRDVNYLPGEQALPDLKEDVA